MTTQAIDATIFASSHPDIAKRTSVSGLIFSCIMLLAGVIAFVFSFLCTTLFLLLRWKTVHRLSVWDLWY